jgi:SSS family solute:Na+ symporter
MAAGLAALMSTMDSQLLTLSSIFSRDIAPWIRPSKTQSSISGRIFVILLSVAGLALAYKPPATILQIATQTFTGLAVLFPTVIFGLYLKRVFSTAAILSILLGEAIMTGFYFKLLAADTFLPVVWVMLVSFGTYLTVHGILSWREKSLRIVIPTWLRNVYFWLLVGIFLLAMDFWAWREAEPTLAGIPLWVGYFIVLSALQTGVMLRLTRPSKD